MTAQIHERLILDGTEVSMAFCPPLPEGNPRLVVLDPEELERDPPESILRSTACWRGYQGTWEIKDGRFFLRDLQGRVRLRPGDPLLADWFTGVLRIPIGEMLQYVHMGFGSVFEEELHIKIERGIVVARRTIDNRGQPHDPWEISWRSMPGEENHFPGDDEM